MGNITDGSYDLDSDGKYLLISVPKFKQDPISGKEMTSYLRLGASSSTWEKDPGGDLAKEVALAGPTGGPVTPNGAPVSPDGDDPRPVFIDDLRHREGSPVPHQLSVGERLAESKILHTRGGWRDHSDGNRISTTYGDKIEVIRGNYKMVVLGRQDDASKAAGLDISGQHLQTYAYTNPSLLRVSWTQDLGGVWHIEEASEGVVSSVNFAGDEYEFKWGEHHESTTGSEAPADADPVTGGTRKNPVIIEKTWAERIESYTGSAALPIPRIMESTFADTISSETTASSTSETTTVSGAITSVTTAASISDVTTAANINGVTTAANINEVTTVGLLNELWIGNKLGATVGTTTEVFVGNKAAASLALSEELNVGGIVNIAIAAALDVFLGYKCEVNMGPRTNIELSLETVFGSTCLKVSGTHTSMHGVETEIGMRFFV
jgi:hypothetical protein